MEKTSKSISNRFIKYAAKYSEKLKDYYWHANLAENVVESLIDNLDQYSSNDVLKAIYLIEKYDLMSAQPNLMRWFDPDTYLYIIRDRLKKVENYYVLNDDDRLNFPPFEDNTIVEDGIINEYVVPRCFEIGKAVKWVDPEDFYPYEYLIGENMIIYKYTYEYIVYPIKEYDLILEDYFN